MTLWKTVVIACLLLVSLRFTAFSDTSRPIRNKTMLLENHRPPDFTLTDISGQPLSLHAFLVRSRIILVFDPSQEYLAILHASREQLLERDLVALAIVSPNSPIAHESSHTSNPPIWIATDPNHTVARQYGADSGQPTFYLIGKDGTIKMARHGYPANKELFGIIDAMPMRQQEMRERR